METMDAIRRIKAEIPGAFTTLGVSNVSFGLAPAARHVLNSVFIHECVEAGLDSAIVHASKILPLSRIPDEQRDVVLDLIYDRRGTAGLQSGLSGSAPLPAYSHCDIVVAATSPTPGGMNPPSALAMLDLPDPDSPTMATRSRVPMVNEVGWIFSTPP